MIEFISYSFEIDGSYYQDFINICQKYGFTKTDEDTNDGFFQILCNGWSFGIGFQNSIYYVLPEQMPIIKDDYIEFFEKFVQIVRNHSFIKVQIDNKDVKKILFTNKQLIVQDSSLTHTEMLVKIITKNTDRL